MNEYPGSSNEVIFSATLPASLQWVGLVLAKRDDGVSLEVSRKGQVLAAFRVPGDLSKQDLPYWICSILRVSVPDLNEKALDTYEREIRRRFRGDKEILTLCLGPKALFHECTILHIDLDFIQAKHRDCMVSLKASVKGLNYVSNKALLKWTFLFRATSELAARIVEQHIRPTDRDEQLVSLDGEVTGIIAFNNERWEAVGYSAAEVMEFAAARGISLAPLEKVGPGISFRVVGA